MEPMHIILEIRDNGVYQLPLSDHTKREFMYIKYDFFHL